MKSKVLMSLCAVAVSAALVIGGTFAFFSDYGTSNGNVFAAGTLNLTVDGKENNVVKFNVTNMRPGNQPKDTYTLKNTGSLDGYLNLSNVSVVNNENGITAPEALAGDTTVDVGELGDVVNVKLFTDVDGDGWIGANDTVFYNGKVSAIPSSFKLNKTMAAGSDLKVTAIFDWWDTADDNKAQNDSMQLNFRFDLSQNALN